MEAARIQARAVFKVAAIVLAAIAVAVLLSLIFLRIETTLRWIVAAVFLALALAPAVGWAEGRSIRGRGLPRWLSIIVVYLAAFVFFLFVVLQVIPPIVSSIEDLGSQLPTYVKDFEQWAEQNSEFRELNDKYDITATLTQQAKELPSHLGDAASEAGSLTVTFANNLIGGVTVLALAFFLLLDRGKLYRNAVARLPGDAAARGRRIGDGVYKVVRSYVTMTLLFAIAAGVFTWVMMELLGLDLAIPLAVIVGFCDLIPLIGLTLGGMLVAIAAGIQDFPGALIIWLVAFLIYQQLQDRVLQPLVFRRGAVRLNPAIAIVSILVGAELLGVLGALIAIPVAASIGVIAAELIPEKPASDPEPKTAPAPAPAADG
jgi:predicted PurR-regulated permease PerM